ncbi:hypothetical protein BU15DRAFT_65278 [Melanogaster broomeanus]|nr:hypothetical protein BU15DRAFT_65278 [Melanogaster broomeanus]
MAYTIELNDGTVIEVPDLTSDGSNWKTYRDIVLYIATLENVVQQFNGTDAKPVEATGHEFKAWERQNKVAQLPITLTIPDSLLIHVMHLETAREWFKYLTDQFETKTSNVTQREATCDPRTAVSTHQKHSEDARKPQERKATVNERENTTVEESRNVRHRERKRKARDEGRVEKRDRRGKRAARQTSEQEAAAREPGSEAADEAIRSISLTVMPSSQDDDGRDTGVPCTTVNPHKPKSTHPVASEAAADTANPNATSAMPTEPAGGSPKPQDELHESTDQTANGVSLARPASSPHNKTTASAPPSVLFEGERESEVKKGEAERLKGRASEKIAADRRPGEGVSNQSADLVSLTAPVSSLNDSPGDEPIAKGPSEDAADETTDDISLAAPASSPVNSGVATPSDGITDATVNGTETPPSTPLEGECDAQRCANGARTGQQHSAIAHGEDPSAWTERRTSCTTNSGPRVPDGIVDDPSECTEPGTSGSPLSILLEGSSHQVVTLTTARGTTRSAPSAGGGSAN